MSLRSVGHQVLPRKGESESGDAVFVRHDDGASLVAVVDALGHGKKAALVAQRAIEIVSRHVHSDGVLAIMQSLHAGLSGTRGACALVSVFSPEAMEVCSVGNVELRVTGMQIPFVLSAGVLGSRMVRPRVVRVPAPESARLAIYSDGLSSRFHLPDFASMSTTDACRAIFERHRRDHDDASLVIADVAR